MTDGGLAEEPGYGAVGYAVGSGVGADQDGMGMEYAPGGPHSDAGPRAPL